MSHMGFWDSGEKSVLIDEWFCSRHAHTANGITDSDRNVTLMETKAGKTFLGHWTYPAPSRR